MRKLTWGFAALLLLPGAGSAQTPRSDEANVRQVIADWNAAYRRMDASAIAALFTADVEIIDRFGHWVKSNGTADTERLWQLTFTQIYRGRPGPERTVEAVRMLTPDVAVVQATAQWDAVRLEDGTVIPPHGEIDTFLLVQSDGEWRIALLNIHNQMAPGSERPGERVPGRGPQTRSRQ